VVCSCRATPPYIKEPVSGRDRGPEIEALQRELRGQQRAADVALLREFAPQLPEAELEPLGEIVRSALTGLALWWLEHPGTPRAVVVAAVLRTTRGVLSTVC
jgi:hypothetical protein